VIVLDASAVVEMCLGSNVGKKIAKAILLEDDELIAPELLPLEVIHALRRQLYLKFVTETAAAEAFKILNMMPIQMLSHADLLHRTWQLKSNMTAYDACYVALSEKLGSPIWTCDRKYEKTPLHSAKIVYFDRPTIVTPL
jgi:predicted nucleic acid-binding protein